MTTTLITRGEQGPRQGDRQAADLNGRTGTQTVEEGAAIIVRMARIGPDGPTGTFVSAHGPVAW
jgi:hypothetical protein